jgi:glycosyltransferase involved in cell wall biosynthesis
MRILIALTYYQPYKSGLTVYAVQLARALVALGHEVTVLTSRYVTLLKKDEIDHGVRIVRLPVVFQLSKAVIMPQLPFKAWQLIKEADIVNLHVPQMDAAFIAFLAKMRHKPIVLTYHCDLLLPKGLLSKVAGWGANLANQITASFSDAIVHNTADFAAHSKFLSGRANKLTIIQPPILVEEVSAEEVHAFRVKYNLKSGQKIVGMVARLAAEKGVEYLVNAMDNVIKYEPEARVVFVGEYQHVIGEEAYRDKLLPMIEKLQDHWTFLGKLSEKEKAAFFKVCDVLVLPSINSTESFGMVQVEAMVCGTPVVATDLPGVRQPVKTTGMGEVVPPRDSTALATAIIRLISEEKRTDPVSLEDLRYHYSPETIAKKYFAVFERLLEGNG